MKQTIKTPIVNSTLKINSSLKLQSKPNIADPIPVKARKIGKFKENITIVFLDSHSESMFLGIRWDIKKITAIPEKAPK